MTKGLGLLALRVVLQGRSATCLMLLSLLNGAEVDGSSMNCLFYSVCPSVTILMCAADVPPRSICAKWGLQGKVML